MDKAKLDEIIKRNKAQPVGFGYIDIIISRAYYKAFVWDLIKNNFKIVGVSWWEWCLNEKESKYGLGGPKSDYYDGWFSELAIDVDEIISKVIEGERLFDEITSKIELKSISFPNESLTFRENEWLTPAIWLDVPEEWKNNLAPDN